MTPFEQELGLKMNPGEAFVETSLAVPAHDHLVIGDEVPSRASLPSTGARCRHARPQGQSRTRNGTPDHRRELAASRSRHSSPRQD
jgi:hypothetical protein